MALQQTFDAEGNLLSPVLEEGIKNFMVDIDGTISEDIANEEPEKMPDAYLIPGSLEMCNQWYEEGHVITFFTSRIEKHRKVTEDWLDMHGFKYHGILFGKPRGGNYHWIDNHIVRATQYKETWDNLVDKDVTIQVFKGD
jgi:hypothetical protein|tara:strand:+ start:106 stop:525 length:420 start_codon:yes stop_codon:yes gene_type:complete